MTGASLLHTAVRICCEAHAGQSDKAGDPYVFHCADADPKHYQVCMRGGWGEVMRGAVLYLTPAEFSERSDLMSQTHTGELGIRPKAFVDSPLVVCARAEQG